MPILAGLPVLDEPPAPVDTTWVDTRTLGFQSLDGQTLIPFTGTEWIARWGLQGLDLPKNQLVEAETPGMDGSLLLQIKIGARDVFVPLFVGADSGHLAYLDRRDQLAGMLNHHGIDYQSNDGTFDLVATSARGTRFLRCTYVGGMDGDLTQDSSGTYWESVGLNLRAVQPYWRGAPWATPTFRQPVSEPWFDVFPGQLGGSALGEDIPVVVRGDVPSWVTVDLVGPATTVLIAAPGLSVSIPAGLASGETARIVTNPRGRTALFAGVANWARIAPSDRYRPLMPGLQTISIDMTGLTSVSSVVVSGDSLWKRPW